LRSEKREARAALGASLFRAPFASETNESTAARKIRAVPSGVTPTYHLSTIAISEVWALISRTRPLLRLGWGVCLSRLFLHISKPHALQLAGRSLLQMRLAGLPSNPGTTLYPDQLQDCIAAQSAVRLPAPLLQNESTSPVSCVSTISICLHSRPPVQKWPKLWYRDPTNIFARESTSRHDRRMSQRAAQDRVGIRAQRA
jgi:hypothetical protein